MESMNKEQAESESKGIALEHELEEIQKAVIQEETKLKTDLAEVLVQIEEEEKAAENSKFEQQKLLEKIKEQKNELHELQDKRGILELEKAELKEFL